MIDPFASFKSLKNRYQFVAAGGSIGRL